MNTPSNGHELAIVTGASRGLGLALAAALHGRGATLLTISRRPCLLPAADGRAPHDDWNADLAEPLPLAGRLEAWLQARRAPPWRNVLIVHNAASLSTPAPLADVPLAELAQAMRVNLEAPLVLSAAFLRATAGWRTPRKLVFVSSGLGRTAMAGAASYCAAKAGLDHLARALALEEAARPNGARVVSLAPGVIDTDMQVQLRAADATVFPARQRFVALDEGGQLATPAAAAARVLACLDDAGFGTQPVTDVRDFAGG
ncbi:MAG: SDR family NAD(P)-dependent oxidoreductase [Rubrivivax sp.]|nr:SDR family NAD(P)-dependent oxidoreductase [Rubrivivax sp.]